MGTAGVRDRFRKFTHGDYFNREFLEKYWVPFLRNGEVRPTDWEQKRNTAPWWQSLLSWLPLKYALILQLVLGGIAGWRWNENRHRVELDTGPEINIGHYLGMPILVAPFKVRNGTSREVTVQTIRVTLVSPKGREVPLQAEGTVMLGQTMPPLTMVFAKPRESVDFNFSYFNYTTAFTLLQQEAVTKAIQSGVTASAPNESLEFFTSEFAGRLTAFAREQFIWEAGEWLLTIGAQRDEEALGVDGRFQVDEADVQRMWRITEHYRSGIGVLPNWRFVSFGDYHPVMVKRLEVRR